MPRLALVPSRPTRGPLKTSRSRSTSTDVPGSSFESVPTTTLKKLASDLRAASQQLESAEQQLHELATTDPLTGCHNRRFYGEIIDHEFERHRRNGWPMTLVFIDIDGVKLVNDHLGHAMGDRLIRRVATLLKRHVRSNDYVIRWGGDEFVVLMTCSETEARRKGTTLKRAFSASIRRWALPSGVGLSIGCAELGPATDDVETLVRQADDRMYADKKKHRKTLRVAVAS